MTTYWVEHLLQWFEINQRYMPWREQPSPYHTWISEIMLQQTQVATVIPYFQRFIASFPSITALAQADQDSVLKHWEGLGYYSRARNLHKAAKVLVSEYQAQLPKDFETLQKLPGIGFYTGAAISSIAFEQPVPVVDGNVLRVFTRFWGIYDDIRNNRVKTMLFHKLSSYVNEGLPSQFNQAIMELGALICQPQNPQCGYCPLKQDCFAYEHKKQTELPVKSPAKKVPIMDVVVALIIQDKKFLIAKRKEEKMLGGLWELPGGKIEIDETPESALIREINEELGVKISLKFPIGLLRHAYSHFKIKLNTYVCEISAGTPKALSGSELAWVTWEDLADYAFPKATLKVFDLIKKQFPELTQGN